MAQAALSKGTGYTADERRAEISRVLVCERGITKAELSRRYGVSATTIASDIRMIKREWREARLANADAMIAQDLAELGMVKQEAWRAYAASLDPKISRSSQVTTPVVAKVNEATGETEMVAANAGTQTVGQTENTPIPNLKALELVTKCVEKKQALLGYGEGVDKRRAGGDKARVFAFTVKIGDKVLTSQATDVESEAVDIDVEDAEFYEVDSMGKKALASGSEGEGGDVQ